MRWKHGIYLVGSAIAVAVTLWQITVSSIGWIQRGGKEEGRAAEVARLSSRRLEFAYDFDINSPGLPTTKLKSGPPKQLHGYISHSHKFIYLKNTKTGGTTVLRKYLEPAFEKLNEQAVREEGTKLFDLTHLKPSTYPRDELERYWSEYFVFATARNPWFRAVSIYRYQTEKQTRFWQQKHSEALKSSMALSDYCRNPHPLIHRNFDSRVKDAEKMLRTHANLQYPGLFTRKRDPSFDALVRTERLATDLAEVIDIINSRLHDTPPLPSPSFGSKDYSSYCSYLRDAGGSCAQLAPFYFDTDAQLLGHTFPCNV